MMPDAEKEYRTAVAVGVAISHYQKCLNHIANVPWLYTSTVTGNDDSPRLEPANPCDETIGNEFLESDTSLKITGLKCCILMLAPTMIIITLVICIRTRPVHW